MITTKTITGTTGSENTPCNIIVANDTYCNYYVAAGGTVINATYEDLENGVNIETVNAYDCFTWSSPVNSEQELEKAVSA